MSSNNYYRNNYRASRKMSQQFDAYWSKHGFKSQDELVKQVIAGIFNLFNQDINRTLDDTDYNYEIDDREDFAQICKEISKVLDKYITVDSSDVLATTESVKSKIKIVVWEQIGEFLKKYNVSDTGNKLDKDEIRTSIHDILDDFFEELKNKNDKTKKLLDDSSELQKKNNQIISRFSEILSKIEKPGVEKELVKRIQNTKTFKEFKVKLYQNSALFKDTLLKKINAMGRSEWKNFYLNEFGKSLTQIITLRNRHKDKLSVVNLSKYQKMSRNIQFWDKVLDNKIKGNIKSYIQFKKLAVFFLVDIPTVVLSTIKTFMKPLIRLGKRLITLVVRLGRKFFNKMIGTLAVPIQKFFVAPIKKMYRGLREFLIHPLQTLNNMLTGNWFIKFMIPLMRSPQFAFQLGVFVGFANEFLKKYILVHIPNFDNIWDQVNGFLKGMVFLPTLKFLAFITDFLNPKKHGGISFLILSFIRFSGWVFSTIAKLFKDVPGLGTLEKLIYNMASIAGCGEDVLSLMKVVFKSINLEALVKGYFALKHTFLGSVASSIGGLSAPSLIAKVLLSGFALAGSAIGQGYDVDKDNRLKLRKKYEDKISEQAERSQLRHETLSRIDMQAYEMGKDSEEYAKQRNNVNLAIDRIMGEFSNLNQLGNLLEDLSEIDSGDKITEEQLNEFLIGGEGKEALYKKKYLQNIIQGISSQYGMDFRYLNRDQQLKVLQRFVQMRWSKANELYYKFKGQDLYTVIQNADELLKTNDEHTLRYDIETKTVHGDNNFTIQDYVVVGKIDDKIFEVNYRPLSIRTDDDMNATMESLRKGYVRTNELGKYLEDLYNKGEIELESFENTERVALTNKNKGGFLRSLKDSPKARQAIRRFFEMKAHQQASTETESKIAGMVTDQLSILNMGGADFKLGSEFSEYMKTSPKVMEEKKRMLERAKKVYESLKDNENFNIEGEEFKSEIRQIVDESYTKIINIYHNTPVVDDVAGENNK